MNKALTDYLFTKRVFVYDAAVQNEHPLETLFSLAKLFDIKIVEGEELAQVAMIEQASRSIGRYVHPAFYQGFPETVKRLTREELLFDQLVHYWQTYGFGNFDDAGRSVLEEKFERLAFRENCEPKEFRIIQKTEALKMLNKAVSAFLKSSRPLSETQYQTVLAHIAENSYQVTECCCTVTAIRLILDTGDLSYAEFLRLSDVIRFVDELNYRKYENENIKKLNLKNADRKTVETLIDLLVESNRANVTECFEKKALWAGVLHHIHYRPKTEKGEKFVALMRGDENRSVYSTFEKAMAAYDIDGAVACLCKGKGTGALLRRLNYLLSRCKDEKDVVAVLKRLKTGNGILLIQLLHQYANYGKEDRRTFLFTKYERLRKHKETADEKARRKSEIPEQLLPILVAAIRDNLRDVYKGRLGKVYVDKKMKKMALPLQETTSQGGFGVLPKGSRLPLEKGKKIRAFTYWEKVDDIDLSAIGVSEEGEMIEFSWRSMYENQGDAIAFSGDQTSGFYGGSEFYDVNFGEFKRK
ncbi:MAG: hypothetical protein IJB97_10860 [Clostridia bacterium]|nr:hypothetical protein [Clostridia bacterium]